MIAFGSCAHQDRPQPVWDAVGRLAPDAFLFLGDAIYADTTDPVVMAAKYAKLGAVPGFARLRATTPILAVWDDHDYGADDAGADYAMKDASRALFLGFFRPGAAPPRAGVHDVVWLGSEDRRVQILLLDVRWSRGEPGHPAATILGDDQWRWLEANVAEPAALRLVVSGSQAIARYHGRESWADFPRERERLFDLLAANGPALILSGDRHFAELSRLAWRGRAIYDFTASGLNLTSPATDAERNAHRVGASFHEDHFGVVTIRWGAAPRIELTVRDVAGTIRLHHTIPFTELGR